MKILVAEDDELVRRLLQSFLSKWGYDVHLSPDGLRAWEALQEEEAPRLVLLDWMMPGMDGVDICRALRQANRESYTYIVLLTSRSDRQDMLEGLEAGADDYLIKPFHPEELRARLRSGRRILELEGNLRSARELMRLKALHDPLTELWNHGAVLGHLPKELMRAARESTSLGLLMLDVDHFKGVNDRYGHAVGDQVLQEIARRITAAVRSYDFVSRCGGEEFLILLPGCDEADSRARAEHVRVAIAERPIETTEGLVAITVSIGALASRSWPNLDAMALWRTADAALYQAKAAGRNCVVLATPETSSQPARDAGDSPIEHSGVMR